MNESILGFGCVEHLVATHLDQVARVRAQCVMHRALSREKARTKFLEDEVAILEGVNRLIGSSTVFSPPLTSSDLMALTQLGRSLAIRMIYIAGPYRQYTNGQLDPTKMAAQVEDEAFWVEVIKDHSTDLGLMWFAPLLNSVVKQSGKYCPSNTVDDDTMVRLDLAVIQRMKMGIDIILLRSGWQNSKGVAEELKVANSLELHVIEAKDATQVIKDLRVLTHGKDIPNETNA